MLESETFVLELTALDALAALSVDIAALDVAELGESVENRTLLSDGAAVFGLEALAELDEVLAGPRCQVLEQFDYYLELPHASDVDI